MAQATLNTKTVVQKTGVTLELTLQEAIAFLALSGHIGGHPDTTARRFTDSIANALAMAGVPYPVGGVSFSDQKFGTSFYFAEGTRQLVEDVAAKA